MDLQVKYKLDKICILLIEIVTAKDLYMLAYISDHYNEINELKLLK